MKKKIVAMIAAAFMAGNLISMNASANGGPVPKFKSTTEITTTAVPENSGETATTSNTSNASPDGYQVNWPERSGTAVEDAEALKVINESSRKLAQEESYDMNMVTFTTIMGNNLMTVMEGQVHPKKNDVFMLITFGGQQTATYLKDGNVYQKNPETQEWEYYKETTEEPPAGPDATEAALKYVKVEKLEDGGYVIKTTEPAPADELLKELPTGFDTDGIEQFKAMLGEGAEVKARLLIVVDKDMRYTDKYYELTATLDGQELKNYIQYSFSNFGKAKEVVLPEVVKNAKEVPAPVIEEAPPAEVPAEDVPAEEVPAEDVPAEEVPAEEIPAEEVPSEEAPIQ